MSKVDFTTVDEPEVISAAPKAKKSGNANVILGITIFVIITGGIYYKLHEAGKRKEAGSAEL